jgi:Clostripain family
MRTTIQKFFLFVFFLFLSNVSNAQAVKEWTFLLFLNGHNNLSDFGAMNIKDMEKTGSTKDLNIVVEWGHTDSNLTHRLLVKKSNDPTKVKSPILMSMKDRDMGDYKNLVDFVKWGVAKYPARHYFVAVWNHGSGWNRRNIEDINIRDISHDDNTGNKITTEQLGLAMAEIKQHIGRNIDIYGSDACLMQMAEVVTEMKDSVDYFVGSEDLEPGEGWPYAPFMAKWSKSPNITASELSVLLSKEYLAAYNGGVYGKKNVTFSALDVSKIDALLKSTASLAASLKKANAASMKKIKEAVAATQQYYWGTNFRDFGDFVKNIEAVAPNKNTAIINQFKSDLDAVVLTSDNSEAYAKSTGLSVWIPTATHPDLARYKGLKFDQATNWSAFLEKLAAVK